MFLSLQSFMLMFFTSILSTDWLYSNVSFICPLSNQLTACSTPFFISIVCLFYVSPASYFFISICLFYAYFFISIVCLFYAYFFISIVCLCLFFQFQDLVIHLSMSNPSPQKPFNRCLIDQINAYYPN